MSYVGETSCWPVQNPGKAESVIVLRGGGGGKIKLIDYERGQVAGFRKGRRKQDVR